ncbi:MAG: hypothetical protein ACRC63_00995 [Metamycoplasmataceae bacterium]
MSNLKKVFRLIELVKKEQESIKWYESQISSSKENIEIYESILPKDYQDLNIEQLRLELKNKKG